MEIGITKEQAIKIAGSEEQLEGLHRALKSFPPRTLILKRLGNDLWLGFQHLNNNLYVVGNSKGYKDDGGIKEFLATLQ